MDDQARQAIADLQKLVAELQQENERLREENRRLRETLQEAQRVAARQAAPFRRPENKKIPPEKHKKPGRPAGHLGVCRALPTHIDQEITQPLPACPTCGEAVHSVTPVVQYIEDLPPMRPFVTKLTTYTGVCSCCGEVRSTHPVQTSTAEGAAKVHLGARALGLAAVLNKQHGLTMRKTCQVLRDLVGLRLTPGGLAQALQRMAAKVEGDYESLVQQIRASPSVFVDETSWWVGGPGWWLWTFTTPKATLYRVEDNRKGDVVQQTLGEPFAGMLVSDCLNSYDRINCRKHKCIAHHLRAIRQARDRPDTSDASYLDSWRGVFQAVIAMMGMRALMRSEDFATWRANLETSCDRLLAQERTQSGDVAIQNRLRKQRAHLLGCLYEPHAEATNNRAERALRPAVIARKLSCGNKTIAGRRSWEILTSLAATCRQAAQDFADFLAPRLRLQAVAG